MRARTPLNRANSRAPPPTPDSAGPAAQSEGLRRSICILATAPQYPFIPKSNRLLVAGQFWAVPLPDGRFACGRVMWPSSRIGPRVGFTAGLMDWVSDDRPTAGALTGRTVLDQGHAHIRTITRTGGEILGWRPLEADGLDPDKDPESTWGYTFIVKLAERHFRNG